MGTSPTGASVTLTPAPAQLAGRGAGVGAHRAGGLLRGGGGERRRPRQDADLAAFLVDHDERVVAARLAQAAGERAQLLGRR